MTDQKKQRGVIVGPVRLNFPSILEPNNNGKYEVTGLEPHDDQLNPKARAKAKASFAELEKAIHDAAVKKFGKDKLPRAVERKDLALQSGYPLADQDEKVGTEYGAGYESGFRYFQATTKQKVGVAQGNPSLPGYGHAIDPEDLKDFIYSGVWAYVMVEPYAYPKATGDKEGPKKDGVTLTLMGIRFLKTDERLGGGPVDVENADWGDDADDMWGDDDGIV